MEEHESHNNEAEDNEEDNEQEELDLNVSDDTLGLITNVQLFSTNDGPGIRTTVFLKGCIMNCQWCHNPEGISQYPEILPKVINCTGCGECVEACPTGAISFPEEKKLRIDKNLCIMCESCVEACKFDALNIWGIFIRAGDLLDIVEEDKIFYQKSGGGLTISGGEPTTRFAFTLALLKGAKERGINTALDTCGYVSWQKLDALTNWADVVLYDVKHMDPAVHKDFTGRDNALCLANAKKLSAKGIPMRVRVPVIPDRTNILGDLRKTAEFVEKLDETGQILGVDLLPYHPYAGAKYRLFGYDYPFPAAKEFSDDDILSFVEVFTERGLDVTVGG